METHTNDTAAAMRQVGIGTRVINFLVDTFLIILLAYGFYKWRMFYVKYWDYKYFPLYQFFLVTFFVYYTLFELILTRTPGKYVSMSRVRNIAGKRAAWYQVLFRSLLRFTLIDLFLIPFLNMPLHDALSRTRVVEA